MDRPRFLEHLSRSLDALDEWERTWGPATADPSVQVDSGRVDEVLGELSVRLRENYPYFHPRYAGQMLKPPHPVAILAYTTAMHINPNNHALDGGMATSHMEREVVADLAAMLGFDGAHLGHLTSGGTVANLEALWVARSLHPDKLIVSSEQSHYTHARVSEVIGARHASIPVDARGRMDLGALQAALSSGAVGTVVATAGTTGLGAVDQIDEIIPMARRAGARVHVDAAYGGFFRLLAQRSDGLVDSPALLAIAESDSVVVDPHKHGLQPYGCGCVIFRDPSVGRFYSHDSPYTYFTSDAMHLGEITLECSRAGATAAALWATLRCLPLFPGGGLGDVLAQSRRAALSWASLIRESGRFRLVVEPELDILVFFPLPDSDTPRASDITDLTHRVFRDAMEDSSDPVFLAKLSVDRAMLQAVHADIDWDIETVEVLRSVLMKPEHLDAVPALHSAIERHAARAR